MCQAFSCLFMKNGEVLWKFGVDSHEDLVQAAKLQDDGREQTFVRVEITPRNQSYMRPDKWVYRVDQGNRPEWYRAEFAEEECRKAHAEWLKKLRAILPEQDIIDPFGVPPPNEITPAHLALLREWASIRDTVGNSVWGPAGDSVWASARDSAGNPIWPSVRDSVWASVRDSVWASVRDSAGNPIWPSVRDSVWASVGDSVGNSTWASVRDTVGNSVWGPVVDTVGDSAWASAWDSVGNPVWGPVVDTVWGSIWAYFGSLFRLPRSAWKYAEHIPGDGYPYQPAVDLWSQGLVPSYNGKEWRLHGGLDGRVLWEGRPR